MNFYLLFLMPHTTICTFKTTNKASYEDLHVTKIFPSDETKRLSHISHINDHVAVRNVDTTIRIWWHISSNIVSPSSCCDYRSKWLWDEQESQGTEHTDLQGAADLKLPWGTHYSTIHIQRIFCFQWKLFSKNYFAYISQNSTFQTQF